ncbi:type I restriction enzyme HsdR N-terminal domain-containing protein [Candidatus Dojkabacteria bacterium]|nr:type I restriction enzyme HsdR N-terminal domain-containing protein [Candidatus Dojkabacteria bacterium]
MVNEATLEARIRSELKNLFPLLEPTEFSHQLTFKIKLGHKSIKIDSATSSASGRLDILISYKNKAICVLELKNSDVKLTDDDRDQGISYARLLNPMPPFVVVTNGKESLFYKTVDKQKWQTSNIDEQKIQDIISHGATMADSNLDEAVRFLLGKDDDVWKKIIEDVTREQIELLYGDVKDYDKPITRDFSIQREITHRIENDLINGQNKLVLNGPPLSGKTNVFVQLCSSMNDKSMLYLYLNMANIGYGPLQFLCNRFSRDLFLKKTADDIRGWLIHSLRSPSDCKVVLIIDNLYGITEGAILQEINELVDISSKSNMAIILGITDSGLTMLKSHPGRTYSTVIGGLKPYHLGHLSDSEFWKVNELFQQTFSTIFEKGSEYSLLYRLPQTLRIIASRFNEKETLSEDRIRLIESVPSFGLLKTVWEQTNSNIKLQSDMLQYARTLLEMDCDVNKPLLELFKHGWAGIALAKAEKNLGATRCQSLQDEGYLKILRIESDVLLMPTCPELVSGAAIEIITERMQQDSIDNIQEIYDYLISKSNILPYGELVGVAALLNYSSIAPDGFSNILNKLYDDMPKIKRPSSGRFETYFPETGRIQIDDKKMEGWLYENITPWLILSHLASMELIDLEGSRNFHLNILARIGSCKHVLHKPRPVPLYDMLPISVHEIDNEGEILCHKVGIVEPIVSAMKNCFFLMPKEMIELCEHSQKTHNIFLANRLTQAAENLTMSVDSDVANAAKQALDLVFPIAKQIHKN